MIKRVSRYQKLEKIEQGTYGIIYKAKDLETNKIVAIKKIRFLPEKDGTPSTALREIALLKEIKSEYIIKLLEVINTQTKLSLVFEYCATNLKKYLDNLSKENKKLEPKIIKKIFYSILKAIQTLHSKNIIHRDLKPQNILMDEDNNNNNINNNNINNNNKITIKLCEFGLARGIGVPIQSYTNEVASLWYRPPEILLGRKIYDYGVDLWSAGCIFGELLLGKPLFFGKNDADQCNKIFQIIGTPDENINFWLKESPEWNAGLNGEGFEKFEKKKFKDVFLEIVDEDALDILEKLLVFNSEDRASATDILEHKYFKDVEL